MKKIQSFFAILMLACLIVVPTLSAFATEADSIVTYDGTTLSRTETKSAGETFSNLLPGEEGTYVIEFANNSNMDTDWYVLNSIVSSFEDQSSAEGGAYEYELSFTDAKGSSTALYSNATVGGETPNTQPSGLHQAAEGLEDFFYITTLKAGEKGTMQLRLALDGESESDSYMNTMAKLNIEFAVETVTEEEAAPAPVVTPSNKAANKGTGEVKTGDTSNMTLYIVIAAAALVVIIVVIIVVLVRRRKHAKDL